METSRDKEIINYVVEKLMSSTDMIKYVLEKLTSSGELTKLIAEAQQQGYKVFKKDDDDEGEPLSSPPPPPTSLPLEHLNSCVRELYEDCHKCIGSFVFVDEDLGITAFHCVVDGEDVKVENLKVDDFDIEHIVSYPYYDLAIFKVKECLGHPYLQLAATSSTNIGAKIHLVSYPAIYCDSQDSQEDDKVGVTTIPGTIVNNYAGRNSPLVVGQYMAFPNCSGGAVVCEKGRLMGLHIESIYKEDTGYYKYSLPLKVRGKTIHVFEDYIIEGAGPVLKYVYGSMRKRAESDKYRLEKESPSTLTKYSASNVSNKGMLAGFLPVRFIRTKLTNLKSKMALLAEMEASDDALAKRAKYDDGGLDDVAAE